MTALILTGCLLIGGILGAKAQTWSEWWNQKKTRMRYMRAQVVALSQLQEVNAIGYARVVERISIVDAISGRDYTQHLTFFKKLQQFNLSLIDSVVMKENVEKEKRLIKRIRESWDNYSRRPTAIASRLMSYFDQFDTKIKNIGSYKDQMIAIAMSGKLHMLDSRALGDFVIAIEAIGNMYDSLFGLIDCLDQMVELSYREDCDQFLLQKLLL